MKKFVTILAGAICLIAASATPIASATTKPPAVVILSADATPHTLGPGGGRTTVRAILQHATTCQLKLVSGQSFSVVYSHNSQPCGATVTAHVVVGNNPFRIARTLKFALVARNKSSVSIRYFKIILNAPPPPTTTTTEPSAVTTTLPAAATTTTVREPSTQRQTTENWSGYAVTGGPYTSVSGTFTLSTLPTGTPAHENIAEWVGIDGEPGTSGAQDLIQAGIIESMDPCTGLVTDLNGPYNPDKFWMCPWTLFVENGQATAGPIPDVLLHEGDSVTVEIRQQSVADWAISMVDNASGQSWSIGDQYYAGPGSSAEWIVEDPGVPGQGCGVVVKGAYGQCPMPPYSPPVAFGSLGLTGGVAAWYEIGLVQNNVEVSMPSALSTNGSTVTGFSVSAHEPTSEQLRRRLAGSLA